MDLVVVVVEHKVLVLALIHQLVMGILVPLVVLLEIRVEILLTLVVAEAAAALVVLVQMHQVIEVVLVELVFLIIGKDQLNSLVQVDLEEMKML
tara:strand:- start:45 stop:326 length:282 start_codon:yes stop_codon:yes gene_type:complete